MNEEANAPEVIAEIPASVDGGTATPENEAEKTPESQAAEPEKTFTQKELDEILGKRLAIQQRKWEREQQQRIQEALQQTAQKPQGDLRLDQFESPEAYAQALAERKADELIRQKETRLRADAAAIAFHEREEKAYEKYADYAQVAYNQAIPITNEMADAIRNSELGPDIAYHLGVNPKEAERIAHLSPFLQAKEIGRIEAKLEASPPAPKKTSSAPAPFAPVKPTSTSTPTYDVDDPRSFAQLGTSGWIEARRAELMKRAEAKKR